MFAASLAARSRGSIVQLDLDLAARTSTCVRARARERILRRTRGFRGKHRDLAKIESESLLGMATFVTFLLSPTLRVERNARRYGSMLAIRINDRRERVKVI
jgi:hypothetical protein